MRIGFDARCLEEAHISGVGEYALELVKNLLAIDSENQYFIFSNSYRQKNNRIFEELDKYPNAYLKRFSFPNKILNFCFWYLNWPKINKFIGGTDVFFAPNINFLAISNNCPLITTFHDLSFERYALFYPAKTRLWHRYFVNPRGIARTAKKIIAISESTKKDLEEIYNMPPEKINIVYHGISNDFGIINRNNPKLIEVQKKYNLPYKFILYLGNIEPRKNISAIIRAHKNLISDNPKLVKYKLVLAGKVGSLCRDTIKKENVITCGYVEKEDRPFVYNLASLFVYPSFFEGFGLPILEAMACGTPVITSQNSSIPEVAGTAAILVNPSCSDEIARAMRAVLMDEKLYATMRERGLLQAQKFNWRSCAEETLEIIKSVK